MCARCREGSESCAVPETGVIASNMARAARLTGLRLEFGKWLVEHNRVSDLDDGRPPRPDCESGMCLHCGVPLMASERVICAVCRSAGRDGQW